MLTIENIKRLLEEADEMGERHIVLDMVPDLVSQVLRYALQRGFINPKFHYIIADLVCGLMLFFEIYNIFDILY